MRNSTESAETLEHLRGVLGLEQVDGQEAVVSRHVQRWGLASAQEVGDVLHLDKWHTRMLEPKAGRRQDQVGQSARCV